MSFRRPRDQKKRRLWGREWSPEYIFRPGPRDLKRMTEAKYWGLGTRLLGTHQSLDVGKPEEDAERMRTLFVDPLLISLFKILNATSYWGIQPWKMDRLLISLIHDDAKRFDFNLKLLFPYSLLLLLQKILHDLAMKIQGCVAFLKEHRPIVNILN